jgi:hypothetical protein
MGPLRMVVRIGWEREGDHMKEWIKEQIGWIIPIVVMSGVLALIIGAFEWHWARERASTPTLNTARPAPPGEMVVEYDDSNFARYHDTVKHATCWIVWGHTGYAGAAVSCISDHALGDTL